MATTIKVLNEHTINKIAAGEVIENPASVVKELVENSLDAGASVVTIEIQQGGRELIRISDNGCGMSPDDAVLCLERHATSKISEVEDIQQLMTMGFRGEAIPSIAAISRFSILTSVKTEHGFVATLVKVEGGRLISVDPSFRDPGTTMEIKSLFFNVPVRRKFQKSPAYDTQAILKMIGTLALGYPEIQFELISDQKTLLKTFPNESLSSRISGVLGDEFFKSLTPLHFDHPPFFINGFIGKPSCHRPNKNQQYLFLNKRAVTSPMIGAIIREAFGTMLPSQRYPIFVLHLAMPGHLVDVNVHPQKKEVRLREQHQIKEALIQAVQQSVQTEAFPNGAFYSEMDNGSFNEIQDFQPFNFYSPSYQKQAADTAWEIRESPFSDYHTLQESVDVPLPWENLPEQTFQTVEYQPSFIPAQNLPKLIYTLPDYLIVEIERESIPGRKDPSLILVNKKNAYARVEYESLIQHSPALGIETLMIPIPFELSKSDANLLSEHLEGLSKIGFQIREFGPQSFLIEAFPSIVKKEQLVDCIQEIVEELLENQKSTKLSQLQDQQLARIASRATSKQLNQLTEEQAVLLVRRLFECETPLKCPLGKPTITYLTEEKLAQLFFTR